MSDRASMTIALCDRGQRTADLFATVLRRECWRHVENHMLFILGAVIVLIARRRGENAVLAVTETV
jgi:hypothetical protein